MFAEIIKGIIRSNHDFLIHTLDPDHTLSMMCSRGLLSDDEVEMINYAPTEDKKCNSILMVLRRSSVTCFQKFVLLLSEVDTSEDIVKRIVDGKLNYFCLLKYICCHYRFAKE